MNIEKLQSNPRALYKAIISNNPDEVEARINAAIDATGNLSKSEMLEIIAQAQDDPAALAEMLSVEWLPSNYPDLDAFVSEMNAEGLYQALQIKKSQDQEAAREAQTDKTMMEIGAALTAKKDILIILGLAAVGMVILYYWTKTSK